ncbi:MAG: lysophospholipid acyltransferase family protein [Rhizobiales bacterium]|nr:lysophospholipid acyltransferase family protein [Hyphomicrobiales bacterium]
MPVKRLRGAAWFRRIIGGLMARYLTLVWKTNRIVMEPADFFARVEPEMPVIIAMWHGQHFLVPFLRRPQDRVKALISLHHDADMNAIAAERLGIQVIRGSGSNEGRFDKKGGVRAYIAMREALDDGWTVAMTADVPKISKVVGRGIVSLARSTGRPIVPVAFATSRRITLRNWDRSAINLPLGRGAMVLGEPIFVPATADDSMLDDCRRQVQASLNNVTARAYGIVDSAGEKTNRA